MPGGLNKASPPARVDDHGYPQSNIFGNPPAYGFFIRNAEYIVFQDVSIGAAKPDIRPWMKSEKATVQTVRCTERKLR